MASNAAIMFEPEAYVLDGPKLMGRQAAGNAFLRAAVAGRDGEALACVTPRKSSAEVFDRLVRSLDATASTRWIAPGRLDLLQQAGALYVPGPVMNEHAQLRLRMGLAAYSIVGVTHTTASHNAMDAIAGLVSDPLAPWDALICTSAAVRHTVETVIAAERDYFSWRFGTKVTGHLPQLPVIPLGVHASDFQFSDGERRAARQALGIAPADIVALFVGRLSYHAKAHPYPMYLGLEAAAKATGAKVALIQCGWFANEAIGKAFTDGAARYAPSVRSLFTDGKDADARQRSWAAADIFISLSDNVQETFGLAPVEAMAAGIPSVVTDWDGYRDTVRDGVDGFRVATAMPAAGFGAQFAAAHEFGTANYDHYTGLVCRTVSVDIEGLTQRLVALIKSPELRQRLGASARIRARAELDWSHIYRRYRELYAELAAMRGAALRAGTSAGVLAGVPASLAGRLDPYRSFASYPTVTLRPDTVVACQAGVTAADYTRIAADPMFSYLPEALPGDALAGGVIAALGSGPKSVEAIATNAGVNVHQAMLTAAILAKMALVRVVPAQAS